MSVPKHRLTRFERILFVLTGVAKAGKVPGEARYGLICSVYVCI